MRKKYRIAQVGSFDVENYGDLLFADVFEQNIRKYIDVEEIVLFAPKRCMMPFSNGKRQVYSVTELEAQNKIKTFDAIIVGGGDLIHCTKIRTYMPHISKEWMDYEALYMWMIPSIVAWKYSIPLLWNAPGVPLKFLNVEIPMVKELVRMVDYISVRDEISKNNLEDCNMNASVQVIPDTVFSISQLFPKEELEKTFEEMNLGLKKDKYIIFHANYTFLQTELQGCIDTLRKIKGEHGVDILLLPIGYALGDETFIDGLKKKCPGEFVTINNKMNPMEMLTIIANSAGYIGASLHGCITASTYDVPIVVCNYNHHIKIEGFLKLVDLEDSVVYKTKDIYPVFEKKFVVSKEKKQKALEMIDSHFQFVADNLENGKTKQGLETTLCEYVFTMRCMEVSYKDETERMKDECERRLDDKQRDLDEHKRVWEQKELHWKNKYLEAIQEYENIMNSKVWKFTKPIRILLELVRKIK